MISTQILDAKGLTIKNISDQSTGKQLEYNLGTPHDVFGSQLEIKLPLDLGKKYVIVEKLNLNAIMQK